MSVFKCKMCGGTIEFEEGSSVGVCEYCGTKQTLPKLGDDEKTNLYDRANHFRRNNEYDKASGIYEKILEMDPSDSEAYWSLVLCRYGIEYVEDPQTHKRVPTINRAQFTSIFDDEDYKASIEHADSLQKTIYEDEAKTINEIQKGILAISQKEEPFDVFICYKETDDAGRRTQDSVLANDLYHQLTQEGFKVFFSRITLEDKLGTAYEPYIFAALNSAKVMVVIGTKPEYYNAVWVKNEWSRYLALVKQSAGKRVLIPAYRDMDPYDLPEEFSHLQAQDMSKLGFMQDLIRGIKKITGSDKTKQITNDSTTVNNSRPETSALLRRVFMFLEDGDWKSADEYCEKVLDIDPECSDAYIGKLMAEKHVHKREMLKDIAVPFSDNNYYQKAIRFGDDRLRDELNGYIAQINEKNEVRRLTELYDSALTQMVRSSTEDAFLLAAASFDRIKGFKNADEKATECRNRAKKAREDVLTARYDYAVKQMEEAKSPSEFNSVATTFESLKEFEDAQEKARECRERANQIIEESNAALYDSAVEQMEKATTVAEYLEAAKSFEGIWGFKDAKAKATECRNKATECKNRVIQIRKEEIYNEAKSLQNVDSIQSLTEAKEKYTSVADWKDSVNLAKACAERIACLQEEERQRKTKAKEKAKRMVFMGLIAILVIIVIAMIISKVIIPKQKLTKAKELLDSENYAEAYAILEEIGDSDAIAVSKYERAISLIESGDYDKAYALLEEIGDSDAIAASELEKAMDAIAANKYEKAMDLIESGDYDKAYALLKEIGDSDAIAASKYERAMDLIESGDYDGALPLLEGLNYKDSSDQIEKCYIGKYGAERYNIIKNTKVGDIYKFGLYEQDNNIENGKEKIEWIVLDKDDTSLLLISKNALDCQMYYEYWSAVTWEKCSLRGWLNGTFLNNAFSGEEQACIKNTIVTADQNPSTSVSSGNDTTDKVFLLSISEVERYFKHTTDRMCVATDYAIAQGALISGNCDWWLRTTGRVSDQAATVNGSGEINQLGDPVRFDDIAVRPALWIDLGKLDVTD